MIFGEVLIEEAVGALAAHSVRAGDTTLRKGQIVSVETAEKLKIGGIDRIAVVRAGPNDIGEDEAAGALARALAGRNVRAEPPFTGRSNLFSRQAGILLVSADTVDAINSIDESITVATLPAFKPVVEGEMVATVKIIPYATEAARLDAARALASPHPVVDIAPYRLRRIGIVSTLTPAFKPGLAGKTAAILAERLAPMGAAIVAQAECEHRTAALSSAILELVEEVELLVVFGASAIADRRDVVPAAIEQAGGRIEHFGMPVDPGNLLLLGELRGKPVVGAPGCARSPKENGFDWVLGRLVAGLSVTKRDITRMGVGGLLMEIVSRPQPRAGGETREEDT